MDYGRGGQGSALGEPPEPSLTPRDHCNFGTCKNKKVIFISFVVGVAPQIFC